MEDAMR